MKTLNAIAVRLICWLGRTYFRLLLGKEWKSSISNLLAVADSPIIQQEGSVTHNRLDVPEISRTVDRVWLSIHSHKQTGHGATLKEMTAHWLTRMRFRDEIVNQYKSNPQVEIRWRTPLHELESTFQSRCCGQSSLALPRSCES